MKQFDDARGKEVIEKFVESGFDVKVRIEIGIPPKEIPGLETREGISATVLGSHGKSNVKEMLLGSVSEKVIRKSAKPVLIVKR